MSKNENKTNFSLKGTENDITSQEALNFKAELDQRKKERQRKKKIADLFSVVIIFFSFICSLIYVVEEYGKEIAFWYFFLWFWAIIHATSSS